MSIFDRMTRIARAEFNDIKRRISGDDDESTEEASSKPDGNAREKSGETVEIDDAASSGPGVPSGAAGAPDWPAQRWPREVRQAYAALELPLGASEDEIGAQYRELLKRYDPSKHVGDPQAEKAAADLVRALGEHKNTIFNHLAGSSGQ